MFGRKRAWREAGLEPPSFLFSDVCIDTPLGTEAILTRLRCLGLYGPCRLGPVEIWGHPLKDQGRPISLLYKNVPFAFAYFGTILDLGSRRRLVLAQAQPVGLVYIFATVATTLVSLKIGSLGFLTMVPFVLGIHLFRRLTQPGDLESLLDGSRR